MYIESENEGREDDKETVLACVLKVKNMAPDGAREIDFAIANGLLGSELLVRLRQQNHELKNVVRLKEDKILKLESDIKALKSDKLNLVNFRNKAVGYATLTFGM